jgi:hypothetical protein
MMRAIILVFDESVVRYKQQGCAWRINAVAAAERAWD